MSDAEKVIIGLAFASLAAIVLFRKKDTIADGVSAADTIRSSTVVGLSQTPENASMTEGPLYAMGSTRYAFWPPINNYLPTVTSGQIGQVVAQPLDFARRWITGSKDEVPGRIMN